MTSLVLQIPGYRFKEMYPFILFGKGCCFLLLLISRVCLMKCRCSCYCNKVRGVLSSTANCSQRFNPPGTRQSDVFDTSRNCCRPVPFRNPTKGAGRNVLIISDKFNPSIRMYGGNSTRPLRPEANTTSMTYIVTYVNIWYSPAGASVAFSGCCVNFFRRNRGPLNGLNVVNVHN